MNARESFYELARANGFTQHDAQVLEDHMSTQMYQRMTEFIEGWRKFGNTPQHAIKAYMAQVISPQTP
jgi:hypothetical protein